MTTRDECLGRRRRRWRESHPIEPRVCGGCGDVFTPERNNARNCSRRCTRRVVTRNYERTHLEAKRAARRRTQRKKEESDPRVSLVGGRVRLSHLPEEWRPVAVALLETRRELKTRRTASPVPVVIEQCRAGHEFTPENSYIARRGRRCRACKNERARARRAAKYEPQGPCGWCGGEVHQKTVMTSKYCSSTCRVSAWRRDNPEAARAISRRQSSRSRKPYSPGETVRVGGGLSVRPSQLPDGWAEVARLIYQTRIELERTASHG